MRIKKIQVEGLFGIFNHTVPLNYDEHITLIHGPNGFGKTILLSIINSLFNTEYSKLRHIPFNKVTLLFDDDCVLQMDKITQCNLEGNLIHDENANIMLRYLKNNEVIGEHILTPLKLSSFREVRNFLLHEIPGLDRIDSETWIYYPTGEQLSFEAIVYRFRNSIPSELIKLDDEPEWLVNLKKSVPVRFIETQRLFTTIDLQKKHRLGKQSFLKHSVSNYSEELAYEIKKTFARYGELSESLDRKFPIRLIQGDIYDKLNSEELRNKLGELENKRSKLKSAGLLDKDEEINFKFIRNLREDNANALSIYVADVKEKLSVFDEITSKIELMVSIINKKFLYKEMSISKLEGFVFSTEHGKISASSLSSGEQHELVLLYELLFKLSPNSLVLIDEPELSLHVVWQQQFLKDLKMITDISPFDALIATHSPQIIHDRWDLTVELKGPKDARKSNCR